jgi:hypothetical protein
MPSSARATAEPTPARALRWPKSTASPPGLEVELHGPPRSPKWSRRCGPLLAPSPDPVAERPCSSAARQHAQRQTRDCGVRPVALRKAGQVLRREPGRVRGLVDSPLRRRGLAPDARSLVIAVSSRVPSGAMVALRTAGNGRSSYVCGRTGRDVGACTGPRNLVGRQGFEPRLNGPEPFVLPLDDLPVDPPRPDAAGAPSAGNEPLPKSASARSAGGA